jgi:hypothetical protein
MVQCAPLPKLQFSLHGNIPIRIPMQMKQGQAISGCSMDAA